MHVFPSSLSLSLSGCKHYTSMIYVCVNSNISHIHRAYDYLGPFGVLWVHMA